MRSKFSSKLSLLLALCDTIKNMNTSCVGFYTHMYIHMYIGLKNSLQKIVVSYHMTTNDAPLRATVAHL